MPSLFSFHTPQTTIPTRRMVEFNNEAVAIPVVSECSLECLRTTTNRSLDGRPVTFDMWTKIDRPIKTRCPFEPFQLHPLSVKIEFDADSSDVTEVPSYSERVQEAITYANEAFDLEKPSFFNSNGIVPWALGSALRKYHRNIDKIAQLRECERRYLNLIEQFLKPSDQRGSETLDERGKMLVTEILRVSAVVAHEFAVRKIYLSDTPKSSTSYIK